MKLVGQEGRKFTAHFWHGLVLSRRYYEDVMATSCQLHIGDCRNREQGQPCSGSVESAVIEGMAWCNPVDPFNPAIGRKLALSRAMIQAGLDRPARRVLWDAYFQRTRKPRSKRG